MLDGCDTLVHIANRPSEYAGSSQDVYGDNCQMNVNIFQAAHEVGVRKIIYASSIQAIIGNRRIPDVPRVSTGLAYLPADGDMPARAGNAYGASKVAGEELLRFYVEHRGLNSAVAVRYPMLALPEWYGWMAKCAKLETTWPDDYADAMFLWLSFADAARLTAACLRQELPGYRCYMPAHAEIRLDIRVPEAIKRFYSAAKLRVPEERLTSLVDISRITAETGWVPQDDFRKASPAPASV